MADLLVKKLTQSRRPLEFSYATIKYYIRSDIGVHYDNKNGYMTTQSDEWNASFVSVCLFCFVSFPANQCVDNIVRSPTDSQQMVIIPTCHWNLWANLYDIVVLL